MRVVRGLTISWEPTVATPYHPGQINMAVWSPCSRLIAALWEGTGEIQILDATTLAQLSILETPSYKNEWLSFSPDGCLLVCGGVEQLTIWDLQTGCLLGTIPSTTTTSVTNQWWGAACSMDGKMIAVIHQGTITTISTYNLLSRTPIYTHQVSDGHVIATWTHGEYLQFTTLQPGSITIWEVSFTSIDTLVEVKSLPVLCDVDLHKSLFLPAILLLASIPSEDVVLVWDAQNSKLLLNSVLSSRPSKMSFSADDCFFACVTDHDEVYLWKWSPAGYTLHQKVILPHIPGWKELFLSPNSGSIVMFNGETFRLWHTSDPITPPSSVPTSPADLADFILEFSPDRKFSVAVQRFGTTIIVCNLKSGGLELIIDTGMKVIGLKVIGSTVIVVDRDEVVTWNLPVGECTTDARVNIDDSVQTTTLVCGELDAAERVTYASISPNSNHIAIAWSGNDIDYWHLNLLSMSTGECLTSVGADMGSELWFSPDGCELWCGMWEQDDDTEEAMATGWAITEIEDSGSDCTKLESLGTTAQPPGGFPWQSPHGCKVTPDGWILNSDSKCLMWLPHHWRSDLRESVIWGDQFLGLIHHGLQEPVILELLDE